MAVLMFAIVATPAFCQDSAPEPSEECIKGQMEGTRDAKGSPGFYFLGFLLPLIGIIIAAAGKPAPPADKIVGKSPEYVECYTEAYQAKAKKKNMMNSCSGSILAIGVVSLLQTLKDAETVSNY